ncbi:MAG: hypothetical protein JSW43_00510 [Gemmatimonadota bacterium]|nr:MAG: hypothetical protein JSW43_00510 [Gemmatimonadota bacterium]
MARRLTFSLLVLGVVAGWGCASKPESEETVEPVTHPLPTAGLAGEPVTVYPLTLIAAEPKLGWDSLIRPRDEALHHADSLIELFLEERAPEADWVMPDVLRRMARQAPGMLADPDQMGTALLRGDGLTKIPDPLRSQMRNLTGVTGNRYALVPASLAYFATDSLGMARAELTMVVAEVRSGTVEWRTVARGEGEDPWTALWEALTSLVPGLP